MQITKFRRSLHSFGVLSWILLAACVIAIPATSSTVSAQVVISVGIAPPELPVYEQPICPQEGFMWTPGYWNYADDGGYFFVPGTWVQPPEVGVLWTPGYWGWGGGNYAWNEGYWGAQVGFYGGVNYGFGYGGEGYGGGYWNGGNFFYNSRVNHIDVGMTRNVYEKTVIENNTHVSFNGGTGGIQARPTAEQETFAHERHIPPVAAQQEHVTAARSDRSQFATENHGHPAVAATAKPGEFKGAGVVAAKASSSTPAGIKPAVATTRTEAKPEAKPRTETKPEAKPKTEARSEAKPKAETKPAATREPKSEAKPEAKPKAEPKPAATHEAKPKAEPKPAATRESKPAAQPRAESKPAAEPKPAPAAHESKPPAAEHQAAPKEEKPHS